MAKINDFPLLCTRGAIVFPFQELSIEVGRKLSIEAVNYAQDHFMDMALFSQVDFSVDNPGFSDLYNVGTICRIKSSKQRDDHFKVVFHCTQRCKLLNIYEKDGVQFACVELLEDYSSNMEKTLILTRKAFNQFNNYALKINQPKFPQINFVNFSFEAAASFVNGFVQGFVPIIKDKFSFLIQDDINDRLESMIRYLNHENELMLMEQEIDNRVKEKLEQSQRDFYLREKIKVIREELGDPVGVNDIDKLREKLENNPYPEHVKQKAREEFNHFEMTGQASAESGIIRSYLEWLLNVPWWQKSTDNNDLNNVEKILDEDHYGLQKVKERILEYLAVKQMTNSLKSPIICLVGPPGVGKTSLAKSIARALDRKFVKVSLGGVKDEAEIRGHRRTYLGSMPGRIIEGMKKAGTLNPVFLIDEIDKMGADFKGDPSSAMLEVLDPEQNYQFSDHYLEEPYDLSDVLFIATANYMENIPAPLMDRLEIIDISSYTEEEKLMIAKNHLINKQLELNGISNKQFSIDDELILFLIRHYTREAGVRQLERIIGSLCRKSVLEILKSNKKAVKITKKQIVAWLGKEKYEYGKKENKNQIGVVTGLAYTAFGGDILPVEVNYFDGKGKLIVTGQLGDVMKESTEIALDFVKSNSSKFKINNEFFNSHDIHIHVPEGAVPKDGPSAGVTLTTALVSALTKSPVNADLAMTGEVTLRGNVLPIGGLKEKSMAAHRSGIKRIIIPKGNVKDLDELPDVVKDSIKFIPCDKVEQVIKEAFVI